MTSLNKFVSRTESAKVRGSGHSVVMASGFFTFHPQLQPTGSHKVDTDGFVDF